MDPAPTATATTPEAGVVGITGSRVPAPDLIGLDLGEAVAAAAALGITLNVVSVAARRGRPGAVVAQSPSPGSRLEPRWRLHVLVAQPPTGEPAPATRSRRRVTRRA